MRRGLHVALGEQLDSETRRGLLGMLMLLWPRTTGRRPRDYQNHTADLLATLGYLGDDRDRDRDRDRMRANAGADRRRVLSSIAARGRETGELTSSWGIKVSEQREVRRADLLPEPLDPGLGEVLIEQLRLGPSWTYADDTELADERKRVMAALPLMGRGRCSHRTRRSAVIHPVGPEELRAAPRARRLDRLVRGDKRHRLEVMGCCAHYLMIGCRA